MEASLELHIDAAGLARRNAARRRCPFFRTPQLEVLDETKRPWTGVRATDGGFDNAARGTALEGLIQIEVIGVILKSAAHRGHLAMKMIRGNPP